MTVTVQLARENGSEGLFLRQPGARAYHWRLAIPPPIPNYDVAGFHMTSPELPESEPFHFILQDRTQLLLSVTHVPDPRPADGALVTAIQEKLHIWSGTADTVAQLVTWLNNRWCGNGSAARPLDILVGRLNLTEHVFHCVPAGGQYAVLVRDQDAAVQIGPGGPAVGADPGAGYDQHTVVLRPGDVLLLYNHGLGRAGDRRGREFGADRLVEYARRHPRAGAVRLCNGMARGLVRALGRRGVTEDMALLVVKRPQESGQPKCLTGAEASPVTIAWRH